MLKFAFNLFLHSLILLRRWMLRNLGLGGWLADFRGSPSTFEFIFEVLTGSGWTRHWPVEFHMKAQGGGYASMLMWKKIILRECPNTQGGLYRCFFTVRHWPLPQNPPPPAVCTSSWPSSPSCLLALKNHLSSSPLFSFSAAYGGGWRGGGGVWRVHRPADAQPVVQGSI